jgi:hypothetical protein
MNARFRIQSQHFEIFLVSTLRPCNLPESIDSCYNGFASGQTTGTGEKVPAVVTEVGSEATTHKLLKKANGQSATA